MNGIDRVTEKPVLALDISCYKISVHIQLWYNFDKTMAACRAAL